MTNDNCGTYGNKQEHIICTYPWSWQWLLPPQISVVVPQLSDIHTGMFLCRVVERRGYSFELLCYHSEEITLCYAFSRKLGGHDSALWFFQRFHFETVQPISGTEGSKYQVSDGQWSVIYTLSARDFAATGSSLFNAHAHCSVHSAVDRGLHNLEINVTLEAECQRRSPQWNIGAHCPRSDSNYQPHD